MSKRISPWIFAALICSANAQGFVEEIVVTGIRASADDFYEVPAVTIVKDADFLVQNIRLINDSRDPDLRRNEVIKTINNFIKASSSVKGIEISYGDGFLEPVKLNYESLELLQDKSKSDTSYIDIYVKVAFDKKQSAKSQIGNLRTFIQKTKLEGRTLVEERGDIGLSIVEPQKYRYEIIKAIAAENQKLKEVIGPTCAISIKGLEGRVMWERISVGELMLYIGHSTTVSCK